MEAGYAHPGDGLGAVVAMRMELPGTGYELGFATSSSGEWARLSTAIVLEVSGDGGGI